MRTIFLALSLVLLAPPSHALSSTRISLPTLPTLAQQLFGTQLTFQVAIGSTENPFQMQQLGVELSDKTLAGATNKADSTILYETETQEQPYYINVEGKQVVNLQNSGWQATWKQNSPHGFLICSFDSPTALQRTSEGAVLEEGRFFLYHRMWSTQTLEWERMRRKAIQARAGKHLGDRDSLVKKLQEENDDNMWTKLNTYGQAYQANNKFRDSGMRGAKFTPLYDDQVLEVTSDCILSTRGRVFRQAEWQRDFMVREEDLLFIGEDVSKEMAYIGESRVDFSKTPGGTNRT